jgi:hypothetical protein
MKNWVGKALRLDASGEAFPANAMGFKDIDKVPTRMMPLCTFPEMARYNGTGDGNDGANWPCPSGQFHAVGGRQM